MLPLLIAGATLAVSPAANAASLGSKVGQLSGKVAGLTKAVNGLQDTDKGQNAAIDRVNGRVDTVVKNLASVLDALPVITKALNDPATGLAAQNAARPIGGIFTVEDPTNRPAHSGITVKSATSGFVTVKRIATEEYYLDFGRDVSKRVPVLVPVTPSTAKFVFGNVTNCGANQDARDYCSSKLVSTGLAASDSAAIVDTFNAEPSYGNNGSGNVGGSFYVQETALLP
jgi:hypothetical protein